LQKKKVNNGTHKSLIISPPFWVSKTVPNYRKITDWGYSRQGGGTDIGSTKAGVSERETCHLRELHNQLHGSYFSSILFGWSNQAGRDGRDM